MFRGALPTAHGTATSTGERFIQNYRAYRTQSKSAKSDRGKGGKTDRPVPWAATGLGSRL